MINGNGCKFIIINVIIHKLFILITYFINIKFLHFICNVENCQIKGCKLMGLQQMRKNKIYSKRKQKNKSLKILIIVIVILLVIISLFIFKSFSDKQTTEAEIIPDNCIADVLDDCVNVDKYYVYGTHFNIEGSLEFGINVSIQDVNLIFRNQNNVNSQSKFHSRTDVEFTLKNK